MDITQDEHEFSSILSVRDSNGRVAVTLGLMATVYFEEPWHKEKREAVANLAERYMEQFDEDLKWAQHPKTARMYPINSKRITLPRDWLPKHDDPTISWEFQFHGGDNELGATPFLISAYGPNCIKKGLGSLHLNFPLLWFENRQETFPEYLRTIASLLRPVSGYGGIGILESPGFVAQRDYQGVVRAIAERFPGLEVEARHVTPHHLDNGIKGVNWLTVLSDRWVNAIGGLDYLRIRLDDSMFYFYPYDGGLVIQAGPKPQVGDVNANRWPTSYVTLAKVLKPIQIKDHYPMHFGGRGGFDHQSTLAWLFRLDNK